MKFNQTQPRWERVEDQLMAYRPNRKSLQRFGATITSATNACKIIALPLHRALN